MCCMVKEKMKKIVFSKFRVLFWMFVLAFGSWVGRNWKQDVIKGKTLKKKVFLTSRNKQFQTELSDILKLSTEVNPAVSLNPNVVFVKTHKTGSSTAQNILLRYAEQHKLFVGLPRKGSFLFNYMSGAKFRKKFLQQSDHEINIICHHMRFDEEQVASVMPKHTKYITILREPGELFASMFEYFRELSSSFRKVSQTTKGLQTWINNPNRYFNGPKDKRLWWFGKNGVFFDLGFDNLQDDDTYIQQAIARMHSLYDLVLINDYFEESIVLLKDLLGVKLNEVRYLHLNARLNKSIAVDDKMRSAIRKWHKADAAVFDFFNNTFWKRVDAYGRKKMETEVVELQRLNSELQESCMDNSLVSSSAIKNRDFRTYVPKGVKMAGFVLKDECKSNKTCQDAAKTEKAWYKYLMKKQYDVTV